MSDSDRQQLNGAEWKGYVTRALEDIGKSLLTIEGDVKALEKKVDSLIWKVAGIGGTVALITTLVVNLVFK